MAAAMRGVKQFGGVVDSGPIPSPRLRLAAVAVALTALSDSAVVPSEPAHEPLLGRARPSTILDIAPSWRRQYDDYRPDPADLEVIRNAPDGSLVIVYFGSWCSDSVIAVPHFLKILDEARAPHLKARYVGVDRTKKEPAGRLEGVGLELVPTFVFSVHGHEIGRIVESPATTLERDLALLVRKAATRPEP
jgi:hypothetical protein